MSNSINYLPTSRAKSPLMVPGAESDGFVAPSICGHYRFDGYSVILSCLQFQRIRRLRCIFPYEKNDI